MPETPVVILDFAAFFISIIKQWIRSYCKPSLFYNLNTLLVNVLWILGVWMNHAEFLRVIKMSKNHLQQFLPFSSAFVLLHIEILCDGYVEFTQDSKWEKISAAMVVLYFSFLPSIFLLFFSSYNVNLFLPPFFSLSFPFSRPFPSK